MVSRSIYNLKIDTIYMYDIPFDRSFLQLSNGMRHVMPSTDTKPELTAKASMAQPVSQPAVYANGLSYARRFQPERLQSTTLRHWHSQVTFISNPLKTSSLTRYTGRWKLTSHITNSPNIMLEIKSRRVRRAGHVARTENKNAHRNSMVQPGGKILL
jgi:hypothetical protein